MVHTWIIWISLEKTERSWNGTNESKQPDSQWLPKETLLLWLKNFNGTGENIHYLPLRNQFGNGKQMTTSQCLQDFETTWENMDELNSSEEVRSKNWFEVSRDDDFCIRYIDVYSQMILFTESISLNKYWALTCVFHSPWCCFKASKQNIQESLLSWTLHSSRENIWKQNK